MAISVREDDPTTPVEEEEMVISITAPCKRVNGKSLSTIFDSQAALDEALDEIAEEVFQLLVSYFGRGVTDCDAQIGSGKS